MVGPSLRKSSRLDPAKRRLKLLGFERAGKKNSNNTNYQFWQQDNHPIELSNNEMMTQKLNYIHHNPVEAGIVLSSEEYLYSSAKNYAGMKDYLIEILYID